MKINAAVNMDVEISNAQQKQICLSYLYDFFQWKFNYDIFDENVVETVLMGGSHSWSDTRIVREADEKDYFICGVLKLLKK
jgi:hypothetical protein